MKAKPSLKKSRKSHPLGCDQGIVWWPPIPKTGANDQRIDTANGSPFEKFRERYEYKFVNQLEADQEFSFVRKEHCQKYLSHLETEIKQGYINGLREMAFLAHSATQSLLEWAEAEPDFVSVAAQHYGSWPMLCIRNPKNPAQETVLKAIRLGRAAFNGIAAESIGSNPSAPRKWAFILLQNLASFWDSCQRLKKGIDSQAQFIWIPLVIGGSDIPESMQYVARYPDLRARCSDLPPLRVNTFAAWWDLAKDLLLRISNNKPWKIKELENYSKTSKVKSLTKPDKTRGHEIFKVIEPKFRNLAENMMTSRNL